jgi:acyl-CoA synthetase (NDP forming)
VNPRAVSVRSIKAYPSASSIPDPVDLAVIAVPKQLARIVLAVEDTRGRVLHEGTPAVAGMEAYA